MTPTVPQVKNYMSPAPQTVGRELTLPAAKEIMTELAIRHLPVVQGKEIVGIISDRDIQILELLDPSLRKSILVDDAMMRDVYIVAPETPLKDAASAMIKDKLGSAVVVKDGKICGIFTTIDALRALSDLM